MNRRHICPIDDSLLNQVLFKPSVLRQMSFKQLPLTVIQDFLESLFRKPTQLQNN